MMAERRAYALVSTAWAMMGLAGCGPNLKLVRQYMASSPHRTVAVFPLDKAPGQKELGQPAADMMETKLRRLGFVVADRQQVRNLYDRSKIRNHAFDDQAEVANVGRALGVQAVLVGIVDEAYERVEKRPAQYEIISNPIPACCTRPRNPCSSRLVYDPMVQAYVDSCGPTHRRLQIAPASTLRLAGVSLRVRFVDVGTGNIFWESKEAARPEGLTVYSAADQATDILADRLIEDFLKRRL